MKKLAVEVIAEIGVNHNGSIRKAEKLIKLAKKAGFNLLPTGKRDKGSAMQTVLYTISLVPVAVMPWVFGVSGWLSLILMLAVTFYFLFQAIQLYKDCSIESARKLMYGSFFYLPVVQIAMVIDKIG
jgi:protoheme IX farnesyltransferase